MEITGITVWQKTLPLTKPYWLSGGRLKFEALDSTFVRIETRDGLIGWGEGCPWGETYLPAFGGGIRAGLDVLAPVLIGENAGDIERLNRAMDRALPGHPYAKAALDAALWDLAGKRAGAPLFELFGGAEGAEAGVAVNSSISTGTPEEMVALINAARAQGYRTHSAKVGGADIAADIARIEAIEAALPADEHITYDVNRAWVPGVAIQVMQAVSGVARGWFEQPCETLDQCAVVAAHTTQPIMLDECLHTFQDHLDAWKRSAGQGCKIKPNRLGGLTKTRQVRDFCVAVGWQMHVEDVGGTVLADTAALHLALSTPQENRLASWLGHAHLVDDFAPGEGARNHGGVVRLDPSKPGIGVEPPEDWLGAPFKAYA